MRKAHVTKREAIKALLAISAVGALSSCKASRETGAKDLPAIDASSAAFFTASEFAFLSAVAETIIPQTETAGAVEAGVPAVIASLVSEWGDDNYKGYWRKGLNALAAKLDAKSGGVFAEQNSAEQHDILAAYDLDVFSGKTKDGFYTDMKSTVATAYYMSEPGASEELRYEPVPGDWKGCVDLTEIGRTWAT
jgi:hypothetical protein